MQIEEGKSKNSANTQDGYLQKVMPAKLPKSKVIQKQKDQTK